MLYPQKLSSKKSDFMIVIAILFSVAVGGILVLINHFTTPDVHWAGLANAGILYVLTYSIFLVLFANVIIFTSPPNILLFATYYYPLVVV